MFWIFCNNCFFRPSHNNKRHFFMTSCSHILCSQCTDQSATVCRRCQSPCMIVQCNSQMPDEVKEVFTDVNEKIPLLMKVVEYQDGNRSTLQAHHRNVVQKYNGAKIYVNDLEKKFKILQQKYESLKTVLLQQQTQIDALTKKCQLYKQTINGMTPAMSPSMQSPQVKHRQSTMATPQFSPRNSYNFRSQNTMRTPESVVSSHRSSVGSSCSMTNRPTSCFTPLTPPTKTMELLSLMGKSSMIG